MTQVATYHSINAQPNKQWIGYVVLPDGNQLLVRFAGSNEQDVIDRALSWYEREKVRQARLYGQNVDELSEGADTDEDAKPSGRGFGFAGKIWMINRTTDHRVRIDPVELPSYEAKGYVRGGPRSK